MPPAYFPTPSAVINRHFGRWLPPSGRQTPKWGELDADDDGRTVAKETLVEITQAEAFSPIYVRLAYTPA